MIRLMRKTSIAGLTSALSSISGGQTQNANSLAIINGDETTAGSILNVKKLNKDYTDSKFQDIDLSQVDANKTSIETLNGADTVDGSVLNVAAAAKAEGIAAVDAQFQQVEADVASAKGAVTTLNGGSDVAGSVNNSIAEVVGGAPEEFDTLGEIAAELENLDDSHTALINQINNTKTTLQGNINTVQGNLDTYKDNVDASIAAEATNRQDAINTAVSDYQTQADSKFLQKANALSELNTDSLKATARGNLDVMKAEDVVAKVNEAKDLFKLETLTVDAGKITLDSAVTLAHIDHVYAIYANDEYDVAGFIPGDAAGEFKVFLDAEGDLDGTDVEVQYVLPKVAS